MSDVAERSSTLVMLTRYGMGNGDPSLQIELLAKYLRLLLQNQMLPGSLCFFTEGVRLVVDGSPVLDLLQEIEARGVPMLICLTCLVHYNLVERVKVGTVGGMPAIVAAQWAATKVISL
jgi:hypothetical protein